jgi:hypothetical protein
MLALWPRERAWETLDLAQDRWRSDVCAGKRVAQAAARLLHLFDLKRCGLGPHIILAFECRSSRLKIA